MVRRMCSMRWTQTHHSTRFIEVSKVDVCVFASASASDWTASLMPWGYVCKAMWTGGSNLCGDVEFPLQLHLPLTKVVIHITYSTDKYQGCTRTRESQSYLATHEGQEEQVLRVATSMSLCRCVVPSSSLSPSLTSISNTSCTTTQQRQHVLVHPSALHQYTTDKLSIDRGQDI